MNPFLLEIGGFSIRYYSLMYALALVIFYSITKREVAKRKLPLTEDDLFNLIMLTFFGGLLGGRLYYVAFNLEHYFGPNIPWWEFLAIWHGGLAIHGGLIGGPLALYLGAKHYKIPPLTLIDLFATHMLLAQAIGRIGNLMNGDAHGVPTDAPWGLVFPYGPAAYEYPGQALHPVMIYEMILNLIGWVILMRLAKKGFRPGFLACSYVVLYSVIRSVVTIFRADDLMILGLRAPHVISALGVLVAVGLILAGQLYRRTES